MSLRIFCNSVLINVSCGGLCAGRAFLTPRHLPRETLDIPAKQYNSWQRGTKKLDSVFSAIQKEFRTIQNNPEEI
jgi:hypothetical protein